LYEELKIYNEQLTMSFKVFEKSQPYGNIVLEKSFNFSIRIIKLYKHIKQKDQDIEPLLKQVLRSGTSIGANITEAQGAITKKDFINKLHIALKEARETEYWLELLKATNYLTNDEFDNINLDSKELIKLLTSILKSLKI
jgi:four helix bundle protein